MEFILLAWHLNFAQNPISHYFINWLQWTHHLISLVCRCILWSLSDIFYHKSWNNSIKVYVAHMLNLYQFLFSNLEPCFKDIISKKTYLFNWMLLTNLVKTRHTICPKIGVEKNQGERENRVNQRWKSIYIFFYLWQVC